MDRYSIGMCVAGMAAGAVSGLFGAGGGMVLVPLLLALTDLEEEKILPASISIILPICLVCLFFSGEWDAAILRTALPYLIGSAVGGVLAGVFARRIPTLWLHRVLGILILWGGIRNLC